MSELPTDDRDDETLDASDRRNFLSKSGIMLALLALAQSGEIASAADAPKATTMMRATGPVMLSSADAKAASVALNFAIKAGKVDPSSAEFKSLSPELQKSLGSLSSADLQTLARAQQILNARIRAAGDNNGTIGM